MDLASIDGHPAPDNSRTLPSLIEQRESDAKGDVGHWLNLGFGAREDGRAANTRAVLEATAARFPSEPRVQRDLVRLKEAERQWAGAERCWLEYVKLYPTAWWGVDDG